MIETFVSDPFFNVEFGRALTATFIGVGSAILIALGVRCLDTRGRKAERTRQRLQLASALAVNVEGNRRLLTTVPGGLVPTMEENLRLAKEHRDEGTPIPASYIYFEYFNTALLDATAARKYELGLGDGLSARLDECHDRLANLNRLLLIRLQREYVMERDQIGRSDQDTMIDYELRRVAAEAVDLMRGEGLGKGLIEELRAAD